MAGDLISTGEAAKICSVTPNTVLKWIKSGRLPAQRTPGGHYRIDPRDLAQWFPLRKQEGPVYCWEHNADAGEILAECKDCLVYRSRAHRCYQLADRGHDAAFLCATTCEDCEYFRTVLGLGDRVIALVEDPAAAAELRSQTVGAPLRIMVVESEYELGRHVEEYLPEFVLVDCPDGVERAERLVRQLRADSRISLVRAFLAVPPDRPGVPDAAGFWIRLDRPVSVEALTDHVNEVRDSL